MRLFTNPDITFFFSFTRNVLTQTLLPVGEKGRGVTELTVLEATSPIYCNFFTAPWGAMTISSAIITSAAAKS